MREKSLVTELKHFKCIHLEYQWDVYVEILSRELEV